MATQSLEFKRRIPSNSLSKEIYAKEKEKLGDSYHMNNNLTKLRK